MNPALILLLVAGPYAAAALSVAAQRRSLDRILLLITPFGTLIGGLLLLHAHRETPVLSHQVGGFLPGIAIAFASDSLSALLLVVTAVLSGLSLWFLALTGELNRPFLPPLAMLLIAGVNGALLTADLFNLFVFIEVMLLPSYALVAATGSWRRVGVGRTFVIGNVLNSTILLIGVGLVYGTAGTVNLAALAGRADEPGVGLALALVLTALAIKAGLVPVHGWLPLAYGATSAGVMGLLSALHSKVAAYAIIRIYTVTQHGHEPTLTAYLAAVVVLTIVVGAASTLGARRVRAAVAFQMVSGVGHILVAVVLLTAASIAAGVFYLVHHVVTVGAIVLGIGAVEHVYGTGRLDHLRGLMRRERVVSVVVAVGFLSLLGFPPTSGMWGKVGLAIASGQAGGLVGWLVLAAILVGAALTLVALQRVWRIAFWGPPMDHYHPPHPYGTRGPLEPITDEVRVPRRLTVPALVLITLSVLIFVGAGVVMPLAQDAAAAVLDVPSYVRTVLP